MNLMTTYDPFADVLPQLFREFTQPVSRGEPRAPDMRIDVTEDDTVYTVQADMPGVGKQDIDVEIDGNRVTISAQVNKPAAQADDEVAKPRVLRSERYSGSVSRTFALQAELDDDAATASFENGVLSLTLPKKVVAGARRVAIN